MKKYLLTGLLVWVPLGITIWVLDLTISTLDQSLLLLPVNWYPDKLLGIHIPGLVDLPRGPDGARSCSSPGSAVLAEPWAGQSSSTPGLRMPRGSSVALAARSAAAKGSGRWRSYQGR